MKKSLLAATAVALSLSACASKTEQPEPEPTKEQLASAAAEEDTAIVQGLAELQVIKTDKKKLKAAADDMKAPDAVREKAGEMFMVLLREDAAAEKRPSVLRKLASGAPRNVMADAIRLTEERVATLEQAKAKK